ncbi:MAG: hypothetical protein K5765_08230 [Clostridia bacterium]|nr:hypothetical protein [Clostridia bacterium]
MKPQFSEMEYGTAILLEFYDTHKRQRLFMPTQNEEAKVGYDAKVFSSKGHPIFYQFKVSEYINNINAREIKYIDTPYFRFHTYAVSDVDLNQHNILYKLNSNFSHSVFYVAPMFYKKEEFDFYFKNRSVSSHSKYIRLIKLNRIIDNEIHSICYDSQGNVVMHSEVVVDDEGALSFDNINKYFDDIKPVELNVVIDKLYNLFELSDSNSNQLSRYKKVINFLYNNGIHFLWK